MRSKTRRVSHITDVQGGVFLKEAPPWHLQSRILRSGALPQLLRNGCVTRRLSLRLRRDLSAERRALEVLENGEPKTDWLRFHDRVQIEALDQDGHSPWGAIEHTFIPCQTSEPPR